MQGYQKRVSRSPGGITITTFIKNGIPVAEKCKYSSSDRKQVQWEQHGRKHRIGKPAVVYYENCQKTEEYWYQEGELHRVDGPAEIWYRNGRMSLERWYIRGKKHNDAGWAKLVNCRGLISMFWYRHGKLHNENGPAVVCVMEFTGSLFGPHTVTIEREWYKHGQLGSAIEPALIQRANMDLDYYFIEDDMYLIDEFRTRVKGPAVRAAMRPLPIPVADVIWHHYCYQ